MYAAREEASKIFKLIFKAFNGSDLQTYEKLERALDRFARENHIYEANFTYRNESLVDVVRSKINKLEMGIDDQIPLLLFGTKQLPDR